MSDERAVLIEANVERLLPILTDWALHMAARFNGSVYLVGSTLHKPEPRDCDVRIVLPDREFAARYGMPMEEIPEEKRRERDGVTRTQAVPFDKGVTQRWVDDMAKFSGPLSVRLNTNADVKAWPESYWCEPYPTPLLLAAPSPNWWIYNRFHPDPALAPETTEGT